MFKLFNIKKKKQLLKKILLKNTNEFFKKNYIAFNK
jgi:hypothetical protein